MDHRPFIVDPARLLGPWQGEVPPLVLLECQFGQGPLILPPCPVIGLGDPAVAAARQCDAVIEPPVSLAAMVAGICANPLAAAALVQLLRGIEGMDAARALIAESLAYGRLQAGDEHRRWLAGNGERVSVPPTGTIVLERRGGHLAITLDSQRTLNAIDREMRDGLRAAFELAVLDETITDIALTARGRAFSTGAALHEFGTTRDPALAHAIRMETLPAHPLIQCGGRVRVQVHGACIGAGLEIAAFAGWVEAGHRAFFHLPELAMGLIPGAGGCVSLSGRIGRQRTALMALSGRRIGARTALEWGLVDALVDDFSANDGCADIA